MQTIAVSNLIIYSHTWEKGDQREALGSSNKSGADFPSVPRDNPVITTLGGTAGGKEQREVIGNFQPLTINPDAAAGNVDNEAWDLRRAVPELDRRHSPYVYLLGPQ
jgi:hypothetical protein